MRRSTSNDSSAAVMTKSDAHISQQTEHIDNPNIENQGVTVISFVMSNSDDW